MNTYANDDTYVGDWRNDKRHGEGTITWITGNDEHDLNLPTIKDLEPFMIKLFVYLFLTSRQIGILNFAHTHPLQKVRFTRVL